MKHLVHKDLINRKDLNSLKEYHLSGGQNVPEGIAINIHGDSWVYEPIDLDDINLLGQASSDYYLFDLTDLYVTVDDMLEEYEEFIKHIN